jgi:hypothetical protein
MPPFRPFSRQEFLHFLSPLLIDFCTSKHAIFEFVLSFGECSLVLPSFASRSDDYPWHIQLHQSLITGLRAASDTDMLTVWMDHV